MLGLQHSNTYFTNSAGSSRRASPQNDSCNEFFINLYNTAAESLPEDAQDILSGVKFFGESIDLDPEEPSRLLHRSDKVCYIDNPVQFRASIQQDGFRTLARKWLPHGSIMALYWQFVAWVSMVVPEAKAAGPTVFLEVWYSGWNVVPLAKENSDQLVAFSQLAFSQLPYVPPSLPPSLSLSLSLSRGKSALKRIQSAIFCTALPQNDAA